MSSAEDLISTSEPPQSSPIQDPDFSQDPEQSFWDLGHTRFGPIWEDRRWM